MTVKNQKNKIHLLAADSFDLIRIGLRALLKNHPVIQLVADTGHMQGLLDLAVHHQPDVIVMDWQLCRDDFAMHISQLHRSCSGSKVLVLSHHPAELDNSQLFRAGAAGVISIHHSSKFLLKAINAAHAGQFLFDRHITQWMQQTSRTDASWLAGQQAGNDAAPQAALSKCERRIAFLVSKGVPVKEISAQLQITEKTVRNQLSAIYKKVGVKKQIELCLKAPLYHYFQ